MRVSSLSAVLAAAGSATAAAVPPQPNANPASGWSLSKFKNFVVFGDSYTDENRLNYFSTHNAQPPPAGTFLPESLAASSGGRVWPRYVIQYAGKNTGSKWTPQMTLYNYAVSGAVCSNAITPRIDGGINALFPDLDAYELHAFMQDRGTKRNGTSEAYFEPALSGSNSVYAIWDGTNDIGSDAFLTDSQVPGKVIGDYTDCIYDQFDKMYSAGGRFFVLMNLVPLNLAPGYANKTQHGIGPNNYWPDPRNVTLYEQKMAEYVDLVNEVWQYRTPYEVSLKNRYPDANFALFDVHSLFMDMYTNPTGYYNGSAPLNVTGVVNQCDQPSGSNCVKSTSPDSFMWFDAIHPSEQTDRNVASEFIKVLSGSSKYAAYY